MLLQGKKALILGLANNKSIAYGIANAFKEQGARLAFNYVGDAIKKRVEPLSEELGGEFTFQCDVTDDAQIQAAADLVKEKWGEVDILVHSVAFANREDLSGRFLDTSRAGFHLALDISAYSLTGVCRAFEPLLHDGSSVLTMTYHGSTKVIPGYNIMGVAKAALEAAAAGLTKSAGSSGGSYIPSSGWIQLRNGNWKYRGENGRFVTGWQKIKNIWYYLDDSGIMLTGWQKIDGVWYYLKDWGGMASGWMKVNGVWYYFYEWGGMAAGTTTPDGYRVDPTGAWVGA